MSCFAERATFTETPLSRHTNKEGNMTSEVIPIGKVRASVRRGMMKSVFVATTEVPLSAQQHVMSFI